MFFYFAAIAVMFPYLTIYLSQSCQAYEIGILMSVTPAVMMILQPFWGWAADRTGIRRILVITLAATSVSAIGFLFVKTFFGFFIVLSLYAIFAASILSLMDSLVLSVRSDKYGSIRLWRTIGYGVGAFFGGLFKSQLLGFWSFVLHIALLAATFIFIWMTPDAKGSYDASKAERERFFDRFSFVKSYKFIILMISLFLTGSMVKGYDNFFAVGLNNLKIPGIVLGSVWIIAMIPEIIMFRFLDRVVKRISPWVILVYGSLLYATRMLFLGLFPVLWVWVVTQPVIGFAYGLWYFGSIRLVKELVGEKQQATGQAVFWAISYGAGGLFGSNLSGILVSFIGIYAFFRISTLVCIASACVVAVLAYKINKKNRALPAKR